LGADASSPGCGVRIRLIWSEKFHVNRLEGVHAVKRVASNRATSRVVPRALTGSFIFRCTGLGAGGVGLDKFSISYNSTLIVKKSKCYMKETQNAH
jgi:hypothetical protein